MVALFGIVLGAIGNRCWGADVDVGYPRWLYSKWLAAAIMAYAIVLINPASYAEWFPLVYLGVLVFRLDGTGDSFLAAQVAKSGLHAAVVRAALVLPLGGLLAYLDYRHTGRIGVQHLIASACFPLLGLSYYVAGKLWPSKATEIAELFDGGYLVLMAASTP